MKYLTQKKSGTWYFRYQVPFLYRRFFHSRTEIKKSLHTSDKKIAIIHALRLEAQIKEKIIAIKQKLSSESTNELVVTDAGATTQEPTENTQAPFKVNDFDTCNVIANQLETIELLTNPEQKLTHSLNSEPKAQVLSNDSPSASTDKRTMKELFDGYEAETKGSVANKTMKSNKAKVCAISELLNDPPACEITRQQAVKVRDLLFNVPANINKLKEFKDLLFLEAIEKNKTLDKPRKCLSASTVSNYIEKASSLFIWSKRFQFVTFNPFESLTVVDPEGEKNPLDERHPFSKDQLITLFSTPIFKENKMQHSYQYWAMLIAIYSGARQNEIAQLFKDNIAEIDGIWCFCFQKKHPKQNFKNDASTRTTPIHKRLIELGFLTFVESCKEGGRLFETGLAYYEGQGYAKNLSRWFNDKDKYKQKLGFKPNEKTNFHSFRHTVLDFFKQKTNLEERFAQGIVGHKHGSITFDRYGTEFSPSVLKPLVDMIEWDFLYIQPFDLEKHEARTTLELNKAARRDLLKKKKAKEEHEKNSIV